MAKFLSLFLVVNSVCGSNIFHVKSKVTFYPDATSDYFGYSVLLSDLGLNVGAPKASSRISKSKMNPGLMFKCPLQELTGNVTCFPLTTSSATIRRYNMPNDFFKDDMWFGATMTEVPTGKLLVCAPRITRPYQSTHLLANGACLVYGKNREAALFPLDDPDRQAYRTDGKRKEFGEYGLHLNYFAYGQSGFSVKLADNENIIIGAPGVLQWTGAVVNYKYSSGASLGFRSLPVSNPYQTHDVGPDEYFGYSVEAGVFEENGKTLFVAGAPRSKEGYGQVFIFEQAVGESNPLKIRAKLPGPQLGSYFGSSLCTIDLDNDGLSDLLVGAPNYAKRDSTINYDQGAVFVYMSRKQDFRFAMKESGYVRGSKASGARFGTSIANLGDIDSDGFNDVAIGAPWENEGMGVVYIYKGNDNGLQPQYIQRIFAEDARSFGISISKGYDVDKNKCNDLVIGAHESSTAYLYRSVPTIKVLTSISVPGAKNWKQNITNFNAIFCVTVPRSPAWPHVFIEMKATITVDSEGSRANTLGESEYTVKVQSGMDKCDEQIIEVNNGSDLSKPISLKFELKPVTNIDNLDSFPSELARVSDDSKLHSSFLIQMISDCGEDLICTPSLEMTLETLESPYVPGVESKLGAKIMVFNKEEPAYSVKLHLLLPCPPKRVPDLCTLKNLDMTCDLPAPLSRNQSVVWEIELEYSWEGSDTELTIHAALEDPLYERHISDEPTKDLVIPITPKSSCEIIGKSEPNNTITITRKTFNHKGDISFNHYYEFTNQGPSMLYNVQLYVMLPKEVTLWGSANDLVLKDQIIQFGPTNIPAKATTSYLVPLRFDISQYGESLNEESTLNVTSILYFNLKYGSVNQNITKEITTTLVLEPKSPIWPYIVGSLAGLFLLAAIIFGLYKFGFFTRQKKEEKRQLIENSSSGDDNPSCSSSQINGEDCTAEELKSMKNE